MENMYWIEERAIDRLRKVARRLYKEDRLTGDQMRDLAQTIDSALSDAFKVEIQKDDTRP